MHRVLFTILVTGLLVLGENVLLEVGPSVGIVEPLTPNVLKPSLRSTTIVIKPEPSVLVVSVPATVQQPTSSTEKREINNNH
ncbi:hypothetical protein MRX96_036719 [Rhipicephalus microplus]